MTSEGMAALRDRLIAKAERMEGESRDYARGLRDAADQLEEFCQPAAVATPLPVVTPPPEPEPEPETKKSWKDRF